MPLSSRAHQESCLQYEAVHFASRLHKSPQGDLLVIYLKQP